MLNNFLNNPDKVKALFTFCSRRTAGATGVTAVVAELDTSDRVQVEVNQRRDLEVWIFQKDDDRWHSPDFTLGNFYFANGKISFHVLSAETIVEKKRIRL